MKKMISFFKSEAARIAIGTLLFSTAVILELFKIDIASVTVYMAALVVLGAPVFIAAVRTIARRDLLDEKFLMSIASIGAMIVGEMSEGVAVMLFFLIGEYFEHKAVKKSRKSIKALMDIRPDEANVIRDGAEITVEADDVKIGDTVIVRAGDRVPVDSEVVLGNADVDTSAITGESLPRSAETGTLLQSGVIVINGVLNLKAVRVAEESAAARILDLVENANERKSKTENFITKFSHYYTPIVVLLAMLVAFVPPVFKLMSWSDSIYRALIFLVISCPCALVISVPMAFFGGIGGAASAGILYKGGNTFSSLAKADTVVFDKTGTLTNGDFKVNGIKSVGVSEDELLFFAGSAEYGSNHPIAKCIKNACDKISIPERNSEFAGKGVFSIVNEREILVGNSSLMKEYGVNIADEKIPYGSVLVAKDGKYIGYILISDNIKAEASEALCKIKKCGVKSTVLLSGDRFENVSRVGNELSIDTVKSELLPEEKFSELEKIKKLHKSVVYVGDGINDSPALAFADVGIAMGKAGADSAIESADVIIMSDNLKKIPTAIRIARKTLKIAKENIVFALGVKILVLILGALGIANMWFAVFADVGVCALAILNSMRTLRTEER